MPPLPADSPTAPHGGHWRDRLRQAWQRRGPLACLLWPFSWVYGGLWQFRLWIYKLGFKSRYRAPVPVIVVGNVIAGGAGKTPTVLALLRHLQQRGWRPGVISRGHGRSSRGVWAVHAHTAAADAGDEPLLIARQTGVPVFVAKQRAEAATALLQAHPDTNVLICDDGLQHLALERDLEIVVFDERGVGNGWLLPAGPLRQPWSPAFADASAGSPDGVARWLLVHSIDNATASRLAGGHPWWRCERALADVAVRPNGDTRPLASFQHSALAALAGIARPERFFEMLTQRGLTLQRTRPLPDHAPFPSTWPAGSSACTWLCTEKDAVKWAQADANTPTDGDRPTDWWAVPLVLTLDPGFLSALDAQLSSPNGHQTD